MKSQSMKLEWQYIRKNQIMKINHAYHVFGFRKTFSVVSCTMNVIGVNKESNFL